jgi:probable rRNA maturation factor
MEAAATIDIASECPGWGQACPAAEQLAREAGKEALEEGMAALGRVPAAPIELGITLADAARQRQLNREFRGQDTPTNVLAFAAWKPGPEVEAPPGMPTLLGDVVVAFETVLREAAEQGKSVGDHLSHLVVHGVLHLLGYDHQTAADANQMESLEVSILAKLGIADPYRDAARPAEAGSACHE